MRWRKSWLSTARMECMAKVIDVSGAVDQAKMHACNCKNVADMSFHNFTSDKLPARLCVPLQKFILDQLCTEIKIMANFQLASAYVGLGQYVPRLI